MGGDHRFWYLFGGIWLTVGIGFVGVSAGVNLFADPAAVDSGVPWWIFFGAGLALCGAGGAIIYFARKAVIRDRRLMQSGVPVAATVIDVRRSMIEINRQTRWNVVYRYDHGGRSFDGKSRALSGEEVWGFKPGDKVSIKIDPQCPQESLFLGPS
jgi:hypothetical protein